MYCLVSCKEWGRSVDLRREITEKTTRRPRLLYKFLAHTTFIYSGVHKIHTHHILYPVGLQSCTGLVTDQFSSKRHFFACFFINMNRSNITNLHSTRFITPPFGRKYSCLRVLFRSISTTTPCFPELLTQLTFPPTTLFSTSQRQRQ